ncbi:MAG: hypothetical protein ABSF29_13020 [Tepidisphaeraceae bacterium]
MMMLPHRFLAFLIIPMLCPLACRADQAPATQPEAAGVETCLAAASDDTPIYASDKFPPAREMNATFRLGSAQAAELEFSWVAVDVGDAAPPNFTIASSTLDLHNVSSGTMSMNGMEQPMPLGKYRLDVSLDHQPWKSVSFSIVPAPDAPSVPTPQDLMPLVPGKKWTYRFVQEVANGAGLSGPGIKLDPDGKLRATVQITEAGDDDKGSHLEMRRNGQLVFEEWWRLTPDGLVSTQRKTSDAIIPMKPPQILWPFPPQPKTWTYDPDDHTYSQTYQMWGPLPVDSPDGPVPGYVVMIDQSDALSKTSVERHFIPGIGLAREIIIMSINHKMVSRTEMTLEKME